MCLIWYNFVTMERNATNMTGATFMCLMLVTLLESVKVLGSRCVITSDSKAQCSHLQLLSVPSGLPPGLQILDMSHNNLSILKNNSFEEYKQLMILNMSYNFLRAFESSTFEAVLQLKVLILDHNNITLIPPQLFHANSLLSNLTFSHNKLTTLSDNFKCFCGCQGPYPNLERRNVTILEFVHNNITSLQKEDFKAFANCSIDLFTVGFNKIQRLHPETFSFLSHVQSLSLTKISLKNLTLGSFIGYESITYVSLSASVIERIVPINISHLPKEILPRIKTLYLQENRICVIPNRAFIGFIHLNHLSLESNRVSSVTNTAFCGLPSLTFLNLSKNRITSLPYGTFACASHLQEILMSQNYISVLNPNLFSGSQSLIYGDLFKVPIDRITSDAWNTSLEILDLSHNSLSFLNRHCFNGLQSLLSLNIAGNTNLYVSAHAFSNFPHLESLSMSQIHQFKLDGSFRQMTDLTYLEITSLKLTVRSVPQFTNTSALKTLNMANAQIHSKDLVLEGSHSSIFYGLVSLHTLNLGKNDLSMIHTKPYMYIFSPLRSLQQLRLVNCQITALSSGMFSNLTSLKELMLHENRIASISANALLNFQNLQVLLLQFNQIEEIERDLFINTTNLTKLYLQGNRITTILPGTILPSSLHRFNIAGNPFTCNCQLAWFRGWLQKTSANLTPETGIICSSDNHDYPIWSFHPEDYCGLNVRLIAGVSLAVTSGLFLCVLMYNKRWWLNYKLFLLKLAVKGYQELTEDLGPDDYEHGLNVMYLEADEWWVNDRLRPALQERMPHIQHVAYGDNDLSLRMFLLDAIDNVITNSFKTVMLLSNKSVDDAWFMTKLRIAVEHLNDTRLDKVILIFLEDIADGAMPYLVRLFLSKNKPYMLWTEDEEGQEFFWAQFEKSMRANRVINNVIPV